MMIAQVPKDTRATLRSRTLAGRALLYGSASWNTTSSRARFLQMILMMPDSVSCCMAEAMLSTGQPHRKRCSSAALWLRTRRHKAATRFMPSCCMSSRSFTCKRSRRQGIGTQVTLREIGQGKKRIPNSRSIMSTVQSYKLVRTQNACIKSVEGED